MKKIEKKIKKRKKADHRYFSSIHVLSFFIFVFTESTEQNPFKTRQASDLSQTPFKNLTESHPAAHKMTLVQPRPWLQHSQRLHPSTNWTTRLPKYRLCAAGLMLQQTHLS